MHPSTESIMQFFAYDHLPGNLQGISKACAILASDMIQMCPENAELTAGLRKLLEAKDCFVRAAVAKKASGGIVSGPVIFGTDGREHIVPLKGR